MSSATSFGRVVPYTRVTVRGDRPSSELQVKLRRWLGCHVAAEASSVPSTADGTVGSHEPRRESRCGHRCGQWHRRGDRPLARRGAGGVIGEIEAELATSVVDEIRSGGGSAEAVIGDIRTPAAVEALTSAALQFGGGQR